MGTSLKQGLSAFVFLFTLFSTSAFANLDSFEKRFDLIRNDKGEIVMIKDRSITANFSIAPYIEFIKDALRTEQKMMANKSFYESEVRDLLGDNGQKFFTVSEKENIELAVDSMFSLENLDIEGIFNDQRFKEVMTAYEKKLSDLLNYVDPRVMANLENSRFFYNKAVTYQAVNFGLNFAKRRLSSVPLLNTASYVITEIERMVTERRKFHQNMLLHYFERYSENELGMTKTEVDKAYSSIYESRIGWFSFWESRTARANWDRYGVDRFFAEFRAGTSRLRSERVLYEVLGERVNYAFQEVTRGGKDYIINLHQAEGMFKSNSAIAYDIENPYKVFRKRMVLQLANLGLSFVPVPQFIKDIGHNYFKSHYEQQRLTEGALFAHFEAKGMETERRALALQYLNPFDNMLLKF